MAKDDDWWDKAVKELDPYWEVDLKNGYIKLKFQKTWVRRIYLRWFKRFRVKELYAWMQTTWDSFQMMPHKTGIKHDSFVISKELERKVSRGYQLQGGWTIRESDLPYLIGGPLISEDGQRLLVRAHGPITGFLLILEKYQNLTKIIIGLASLIVMLVSLF